MKLVTYKKLDNTLHVGELDNDTLYALETDKSMIELAADGVTPDAGNRHKVMKHNGIVMPLIPRKIFCVGRNYAEHAAELGNKLPEKPLIFSKYPTCVIGDGDTIRWRSDLTQKVDWEAELVVVIGKTAKEVREADAYEHIFGYTIANDISARDIQDDESQWVRAKAMDTFCPLGPAIVTRDEIADPHNLNIKTTVNDTVMQDSNTKHMIFNIPFLISYLSQTFTLEPGDLILTGTPSGVGKGMKPPQFLGNGDVVTVSVEGIGQISNPCEVVG